MQRMPRRNQGVSIAHLARHLGLSAGTVSRALNGYPDIAGKTRERVVEAAQELGYRPSSNARRLATGVVETVGFVLPELIGHLSDPFLAEMLDSIAIELAEHDWDLIVAAVPSGHDERDVT
ncbi:MAG: LacI family transcriptional regulator, partial [bacterium]|nr:LacI family transcriptional regulator [bacterium]